MPIEVTDIKLSDLNESEMSTQIYSSDQALDMGFASTSATDDEKTIYILEDIFSVLRIEDKKANEYVDWGWQIRMIARIQDSQKSAATSISGFAASGHSNETSGSVTLEVKGLNNAAIISAIPAPKSLNVDSYGELLACIEVIKSLISNSDTIFIPTEVCRIKIVDSKLQDEYLEVAYRLHATTQIRAGHTLNKALDHVGWSDLGYLKTVCEAVYTDFGVIGNDTKPSAVQSATAKSATDCIKAKREG